MATNSGLVEPVEPVQSVKPVRSIFENDLETADLDGQDSLMDEVVSKSLKKKQVKKLKLRAFSPSKEHTLGSDDDTDFDDGGSTSIASGNFVESSIK